MHTPRYKYPRTPHLPWSPGASGDDRKLEDFAHFEGREVVVTEKMDGENTTIYPDGGTHARSIDSRHHPSRAWIKGVAAGVGPQLPASWRLCGENLYARHSIAYEALPSWFMLFSIWEGSRCLDWDTTLEWASLLGLTIVPTRYRGPWDADAIRALPCPPEETEGYVVRTVDGFERAAFDRHVAKHVRAGHVQTDSHWMFSEVIANGLRGE